jgi:hypothetical protein
MRRARARLAGWRESVMSDPELGTILEQVTRSGMHPPALSSRALESGVGTPTLASVPFSWVIRLEMEAISIELVGAPGFEPGTSCSQSKRATGCATPRGL